MADTTARVNVQVTGIEQLAKLDNAVTKIGSKFSGLKTQLAGLGLTAFGRSALNAADDVVDLSNATGIAINRLLELQSAAEEAGAKFGTMEPAVLKFVQTIDEAAQGSIEAQNKFAKFGVTLEELRTLSEEEILAQVIESISKLGTESEKVGAMMEFFGKGFRNVDPTKLREELIKLNGTMDPYVEKLVQASELNGKLNMALINLRIAFLQVTAPIVEFVNNISGAKNDVDTLATVLKGVGVAIAVAFGGGAVVAAIRIFATLGRGIGGFASLAGKFSGALKTKGDAIMKTFNPNGTVMRALRAAGALIGSVGGGIAAFMGLGGAGDKPATPTTPAKPAEGGTGTQGGTGTGREVDVSARNKAISQLQDISDEYRKQQESIVEQLNFQTQLVGKTDEQKQITEALNRLEQDYTKTQDELLKRKRDLTEEEQYLLPTINAELQKNTDEYNKQKDAITKAVLENQKAVNLEKDKLAAIQLQVEAFQNQLNREESLLQLQEELQLLGLYGDKLEDQKAQFTILRELRRGLNQLAAEEEALLLKKATMSEAEFNREMARINARRKALEEGAALEQQINQQQRDATRESERTDVNKAIEQRIDALKRLADPARIAAEQFDVAMNSMMNGLDDFIRTGKLNFKDFAMTMIRDILMVEAKAQAAQIFGGIVRGAIGGISGFIGSLLGFADGGRPPINKPSIVGEKGPELFVPSTAGTIVPNNKLGMQGNITNNYITNNINALDAKSVAQLFAENRKTLLGATEMARRELPYQMA
jgi:hypothetical protein